MSARSLGILVILGFAVGLIYRLYPIVSGQPALSEAFMTEDGYLMLTVARNMAIGLGMTVSDGTIPTNGVQPLATFLFAISYVVTGGDKVTSLVGIHLLATAFAFGAALMLRRFAACVLRPQTDDPLWPWMVALLWFLSPLLLRHTMNGLETGLYAFVLMLTLLQFLRVLNEGVEAGLFDRLLLGVLCGLVFLARNDAVFLVIAVFAIWAGMELFRNRSTFATMLRHLIPPGLLTLLIVAPWLINNQIFFGSIVPISGAAQSMSADLGQNAHMVPVRLFEYLFPMLPIPGAVERIAPTMWVFLAVALAILGTFLITLARRGGAVLNAVVWAYVLHGLALVTYYGLFFGAQHFLSRYLSPLAPLLIIASVSVALDLGRLVFPRAPELFARLYAFGGLALSVALLMWFLGPGSREQGHMQVVRWVQDNVPDEAWVAAVQTGTLGYWHDRTINLDGKVNPVALEARRTEGNVLRYVTESDIDYVADWEGVGAWIERSDGGFTEAFELVIRDPEQNLAVMRRIDPRYK